LYSQKIGLNRACVPCENASVEKCYKSMYRFEITGLYQESRGLKKTGRSVLRPVEAITYRVKRYRNEPGRCQTRSWFGRQTPVKPAVLYFWFLCFLCLHDLRSRIVVDGNIAIHRDGAANEGPVEITGSRELKERFWSIDKAVECPIAD